MPFNEFTPRIFNTNGIQRFAPAAAGVYGISNSHEWVYIGHADNIQDALLAHLRDLNTSLMKRGPTGFVFEVCEGTLRSSRRDRLVVEYGPALSGPST